MEAGPLGVLLIHGLTATTAEVHLLAEYLHAHGYTVAAPLLPGHYTHPADLNLVRWQDWAASVDAMYSRLSRHCRRIIVGGESTGALLALHLAHQHPQIDALLLYASALKLNFTRFSTWRIHLLAPFIQWAPKKNRDPDMPWQGYTVNPLKGVIQLLTLQAHIRPLLPQISQPVLIVHGRLDTTVDPAVASILINELGSPIKEVHWMQNSTHCVILDHEREVIFRLTHIFLNRVWSRLYEPQPSPASLVPPAYR